MPAIIGGAGTGAGGAGGPAPNTILWTTAFDARDAGSHVLRIQRITADVADNPHRKLPIPTDRVVIDANEAVIRSVTNPAGQDYTQLLLETAIGADVERGARVRIDRLIYAELAEDTISGALSGPGAGTQASATITGAGGASFTLTLRADMPNQIAGFIGDDGNGIRAVLNVAPTHGSRWWAHNAEFRVFEWYFETQPTLGQFRQWMIDHDAGYYFTVGALSGNANAAITGTEWAFGGGTARTPGSSQVVLTGGYDQIEPDDYIFFRTGLDPDRRAKITTVQVESPGGVEQTRLVFDPPANFAYANGAEVDVERGIGYFQATASAAGPPGARGADSTVPGPPGADSTVPGPPGPPGPGATLSDTAPGNTPGSPSAGTSNEAARADHDHGITPGTGDGNTPGSAAETRIGHVDSVSVANATFREVALTEDVVANADYQVSISDDSTRNTVIFPRFSGERVIAETASTGVPTTIAGSLASLLTWRENITDPTLPQVSRWAVVKGRTNRELYVTGQNSADLGPLTIEVFKYPRGVGEKGDPGNDASADGVVDSVGLGVSGDDLTVTLGRSGTLSDLSGTVTLPSGGGGTANYKGVWAAATTYNRGDTTFRSNGLYRCLAETSTGVDPTSAGQTDWLQIGIGMTSDVIDLRPMMPVCRRTTGARPTITGLGTPEASASTTGGFQQWTTVPTGWAAQYAPPDETNTHAWTLLAYQKRTRDGWQNDFLYTISLEDTYVAGGGSGTGTGIQGALLAVVSNFPTTVQALGSTIAGLSWAKADGAPSWLHVQNPTLRYSYPGKDDEPGIPDNADGYLIRAFVNTGTAQDPVWEQRGAPIKMPFGLPRSGSDFRRLIHISDTERAGIQHEQITSGSQSGRGAIRGLGGGTTLPATLQFRIYWSLAGGGAKGAKGDAGDASSLNLPAAPDRTNFDQIYALLRRRTGSSDTDKWSLIDAEVREPATLRGGLSADVTPEVGEFTIVGANGELTFAAFTNMVVLIARLATEPDINYVEFSDNPGVNDIAAFSKFGSQLTLGGAAHNIWAGLTARNSAAAVMVTAR